MLRVSAHAASVVAALEPVYGIALAALLLHEIPGARPLVGGVLIICAAVLASRRIA
jgi:drug/metabolite transporter (DMT)-like permease